LKRGPYLCGESVSSKILQRELEAAGEVVIGNLDDDGSVWADEGTMRRGSHDRRMQSSGTLEDGDG
jgi:hypothetical protein